MAGAHRSNAAVEDFDMLGQLPMFAAIAGCLLDVFLLAGGLVDLVRCKFRRLRLSWTHNG